MKCCKSSPSTPEFRHSRPPEFRTREKILISRFHSRELLSMLKEQISFPFGKTQHGK